jgi:hypothetical protein
MKKKAFQFQLLIIYCRKVLINKIPADLDQEAAKKYADRRINEQLGKYGIETLRLNARELDTSKAGARKKLQEVQQG